MGKERIKLAVFISGRGSNLQSIIDACTRADFPAEISVVLSNRPDVEGLKRAYDAGIEAVTVNHKNFQGREDFERALLDTLDSYNVDLVCLAGFMRILTPLFISRWEGKMLNIHPSLLPDYKGLHTHERVLADGKSESGCTVHYVVPDMDAGPHIVQKRVDVVVGDTPDSLASRVLEQEHIAYPEAIEIVCAKIS